MAAASDDPWDAERRARFVVTQRLPTPRSWVPDKVHRRFAYSGVWAVGGSIVARGLTFAATLVAARTLGASGFGMLTFVQAAIAVATIASGLGLTVTATRRVAETRDIEPSRARQVIRSAVLATLVASGLACAGALIGADLLAAVLGAPAEFATLIRLSSGVILFGAVGGLQLSLLYGLESPRETFGLTTIRAAISSSFLAVASSLGGLPAAAASLSFSELVGALTGQGFLTKRLRSRRSSGVAAAEGTRVKWELGLRALGAALIVQCGLWFGQALLARSENGLTELGLFNLAYRWHLLILLVPSAVGPVAMPLLTNVLTSGQVRAYANLSRTNLRVNVLLATAGAAPILVLAPILMAVGGIEYGRAWPALAILAVAAIPTAVNNVVGQAALSLDLIGAWAASDAVLAIAFVATAAAAAPAFGAAGLAAAYLVAMSVSVAVLWVPVLKKERALAAVQ